MSYLCGGQKAVKKKKMKKRRNAYFLYIIINKERSGKDTGKETGKTHAKNASNRAWIKETVTGKDTRKVTCRGEKELNC
jgi:hypothetical protein